jgi:hypothetical protein
MNMTILDITHVFVLMQYMVVGREETRELIDRQEAVGLRLGF